MIRFFVRRGLAWLAGKLRARGWLTAQEEAEAVQAASTLIDIGMAEAAKPHGSPAPVVAPQPVVIPPSAPGTTAKDLNLAELQRHSSS